MGLMLPDLRSDQIQPYIYDSDVTNSTQRNRYRHLNAWLNWCDEEGYLPKGSPMEGVTKPRKEEKQPEHLTPDEVLEVIGAIDTYHKEAPSRAGRNPNDIWLKDLIRLAAYTGLRRNELLALRWKDVDLKNEMLLVRNRDDGSFKTKSGKERAVPLAEEAASVLARMKEKEGPSSGDSVFTDDNGSRIRPDRVSKRFKHYVRQAGLSGAERVSFHTLRHTCASWLAMREVPMRVIQEILGHSSVNVTERYSHLRPEVASKAMQEAFDGVGLSGCGSREVL